MVSYSAIFWKLKTIDGVIIKDGKIVKWERSTLGPRPTPAQAHIWEIEYREYVVAQKKKEDKEKEFEREKEIEFLDNLPSWEEVKDDINTIKANAQSATTIAMMRSVVIALINVVLKLTRVVYLLARRSLT